MTSGAASTYTTFVSEGSRRVRAFKTMLPELNAIAARWAGEEQQLELSELEIRYRWAKDVKEVDEQRHRYGYDAAAKLLSLRVDPHYELHHYRSVGTFIDDKFFEDVLAFNKTLQAASGRISWCHLIAFSRAASGEIRQTLFKQCKEELWSVVTLETRAYEASGGAAARSTKGKDQSGKESIVKRVTKEVGQLKKKATKVVADDFSESLAELHASDPEAWLRFVDETKMALYDCIGQLHATVQAIDDAVKPVNINPAVAQMKEAEMELSLASAVRQLRAVAKSSNTTSTSPTVASAASASQAMPSQAKRRKFKRRPNPNS